MELKDIPMYISQLQLLRKQLSNMKPRIFYLIITIHSRCVYNRVSKQLKDFYRYMPES